MTPFTLCTSLTAAKPSPDPAPTTTSASRLRVESYESFESYHIHQQKHVAALHRSHPMDSRPTTIVSAGCRGVHARRWLSTAWCRLRLAFCLLPCRLHSDLHQIALGWYSADAFSQDWTALWCACMTSNSPSSSLDMYSRGVGYATTIGALPFRLGRASELHHKHASR